MTASVLSEVVDRNSKALRPNNKINSSVVVDEETLKIAECISEHSGKSITKVLSTMLDLASVEFLSLYREILGKEDLREFDKTVLDSFSLDSIEGFISLSPEETLELTDVVMWFPERDGNKLSYFVYLRTESNDGSLMALIPDSKGNISRVPLQEDELILDDDPSYKGDMIVFNKTRLCKEEDIRSVFARSRWIEVNGFLVYIDIESGPENLVVNLIPSRFIDHNFNVQEDLGFPEIKGIDFEVDEDDKPGCLKTIKSGEWECVDKEKGLWSHQGDTFQFFLGEELSTYVPEADNED